MLFAVMVNDLIRCWLPRAKFVDDLTAIETIPRNVPSILPYIVSQVQSYAVKNNMCLNPTKCKIMAVDFLHYNSFQCPPVATCGHLLEEVKSFKFLGVFISHDLTWTAHCDYIIKKANRRLYALRQLKRCGVPAHDSVMVYCSLVRSTLEYACAVFAALPQDLSDSLERIQKRALAIIFPGSTYNEALHLANIATLKDRRTAACRKFIAQLNPENPVYYLVASRVEDRGALAYYTLRSRDRVRSKATATSRFGDFVTNRYAADLL